MNNKHIIVMCPHCNDFILIEELNCCIFRHGVFIKNNKQMDQHASEELCNYYIKKKKYMVVGNHIKL